MPALPVQKDKLQGDSGAAEVYTEGRGEDVSWILGLADNMTTPFVRHILDKDSAKALLVIKDAIDGGYDVKQFCSNVVGYMRDLIMVRLGMGSEVIDLL